VTIRAVGQCIRLSDPPRWGIRNSDVEHFALANQIIQPSHDFFDWGNLVPHVDPIEIDVIGLQPLETRSHCLHHILALVAGRVWAVPGAAFVYFVASTTF